MGFSRRRSVAALESHGGDERKRRRNGVRGVAVMSSFGKTCFFWFKWFVWREDIMSGDHFVKETNHFVHMFFWWFVWGFVSYTVDSSFFFFFGGVMFGS